MIVLKHWCEDTINLIYYKYDKHPRLKEQEQKQQFLETSMRAQISRSEEEQTELTSCHP